MAEDAVSHANVPAVRRFASAMGGGQTGERSEMRALVPGT
mgnify:CR=1 FL=1